MPHTPKALWLVATAALACASEPTEQTPQSSPTEWESSSDDPTPSVAMTGFSITVRENCAVCADVSLQLDLATPVTVFLSAEDAAPVPWVRSEAATDHTIPLLMLQPDTAYTLAVQTDSDPRQTLVTETFSTGRLPDSIPPVNLTTESDESTLTLLTVIDTDPSAEEHFLLAVDERGTVVWYEQLSGGGLGLKIDNDKRIYTTEGNFQAIRVDPSTGTNATWTAAELGLDTIHHEFRPMEDGGFTLFTTQHTPVPGWWENAFGLSYTFNIISDVAMRFDASGAPAWTWSILDHIDPLEHHTEAMHWPFWNMPPYDHLDTPKDWSHANAMVPTTGGWLMSFRNLDWLIKVDEPTGSIDYIFGPGGDFELAPGGRWFSRQHGPVVTGSDTILLYDNGNNRIDSPWGEPAFSRVVEYRLDRDTMTASEVWSWDGGGERVFCPVVGDVDPLSAGTHLVTDGAIAETRLDDDGTVETHFSGRVREVQDIQEAPTVTWGITVGTPSEFSATAWIVYRAMRIDSLYPQERRPQ